MVGSADATLTFDAKNNGEIFMYDNVSGTDGYKVNIQGDGTGTMHLYNDIKKADVTVSNTTLDIGTSTVKMKNVTFADNSTLSLKINGFDDSEHGLLNVSDSLTIADGTKLRATLAQELVADTQKGEENRITLIKVADSADWDNSGGDFTAEHDLDDGQNIAVDKNNMYEFKKSDDEAGTYVVTKLKTAAEIAEEETLESLDSWVAESASAWVDSASFAKGSISADIANKLADLAQNDATGLVEVVKTLAQQKPQLCKRLLPWCLSRQLPRTHWNA